MDTIQLDPKICALIFIAVCALTILVLGMIYMVKPVIELIGHHRELKALDAATYKKVKTAGPVTKFLFRFNKGSKRYRE